MIVVATFPCNFIFLFSFGFIIKLGKSFVESREILPLKSKSFKSRCYHAENSKKNMVQMLHSRVE